MKSMKSLKIALSLLLVLALSVSAFACTAAAPAAAEATAADAAATEAPAAEATAEPTPALDYPKDTVTMIVSYGAGGGSDLLARALAAAINLDGETMICTNITGGSGTIGMMECYNAEPDGYTMCLALPESYTVQMLNGSLQADLFDNLILVACPVFDVDTVSVKAGSQFASLQDLITYATDHPGEVTIAGVGSGLNKLMAIDFMQKTGITLKYIPYEDSNASRAALLGDQVDVLLSQACESKPYFDSSEMQVLAIASEQRASFMESVPTFKELGYDFIAGIHRGFAVTPDTPEEIVNYLEAKIYEVYQNAEFQDNLQKTLGYNMEWLGHDDYTALAKSLAANYQSLLDVADNY